MNFSKKLANWAHFFSSFAPSDCFVLILGIVLAIDSLEAHAMVHMCMVWLHVHLHPPAQFQRIRKEYHMEQVTLSSFFVHSTLSECGCLCIKDKNCHEFARVICHVRYVAVDSR